jgi:hypothetical protein
MKNKLDTYYEMMYLLEDNPAEQLYYQLFTKYIPPNSTLWKNWCCEKAPHSSKGYGKQLAINRIKELLDEGKKVKCGYATTSVRGYHVRYILWR